MVKSILITGGSSGIGAALATTMAERGCTVVVSGRRHEHLESVARSSRRIRTHVGDVTKSEVQTKLAEALSALPAPRAVFHGAGYFQLGQLDTLSSDEWHRSLQINLTARWELSCKCAPHLDGGRILFIGSDAGANPRIGAAAYSIAQSASETLRRALQAEWGNRNIAITGFKPGLVDTDLVRGFLARSDAEFPSRSDYQAYLDRGEIAQPQTVAGFASWLLLDVGIIRFSTSDWDIRQPQHHHEWLNGMLFQSKA